MGHPWPSRGQMELNHFKSKLTFFKKNNENTLLIYTYISKCFIVNDLDETSPLQRQEYFAGLLLFFRVIQPTSPAISLKTYVTAGQVSVCSNGPPMDSTRVSKAFSLLQRFHPFSPLSSHSPSQPRARFNKTSFFTQSLVFCT